MPPYAGVSGGSECEMHRQTTKLHPPRRLSSWQGSPINRKSLTLPRAASRSAAAGRFAVCRGCRTCPAHPASIAPRMSALSRNNNSKHFSYFQLTRGEIKKGGRAGRRHLWSLENRVWGQINILVALPMRSLYGVVAHFNDRQILGLMKKFMCIAHSPC